MKELSNPTKDHVCKFYNYMINRKLFETHELADAVKIGVIALSGYDINFKFIDTFIEKIDEVKQLWEEQPKYCIEIEHDSFEPEITDVVRIKTEIFVNAYDMKTIVDKIRLCEYNYSRSNPVINHYPIKKS